MKTSETEASYGEGVNIKKEATIRRKILCFAENPLFLWLQRAYMNTDSSVEMLQLRSSLARDTAANLSPPASVQPSTQTHKCHNGPNNHSASHFLVKLLFSAHSSPSGGTSCGAYYRKQTIHVPTWPTRFHPPPPPVCFSCLISNQELAERSLSRPSEFGSVSSTQKKAG